MGTNTSIHIPTIEQSTKDLVKLFAKSSKKWMKDYLKLKSNEKPNQINEYSREQINISDMLNLFYKIRWFFTKI